MNITLLRSDEDYENAAQRIRELWGVSIDEAKTELEILILLCDRYAKENFQVEYTDPVEAIHARMDLLHLSGTDLAAALQMSTSRVSELLNYRRKLTLKMIRKINKELRIPIHTLVQRYELKSNERRPKKGNA